jgi:hypothetical protein
MKRQIRRNIFETNSSSIHAISVTRNHDLNLTASIKFDLNFFGWEFARYTETADKASYLWTGLYQNFYDNLEDPEFILRINAIKDALMSYGFIENNIKFNFKGDGDIDHGLELKDLDKIIFNPDRLMRFLFNEDSVVCTFNDNSDIGLDEEEDKKLDEKYKDENGNLPCYSDNEDLWDKWNTEYWILSANKAGLTTSKNPEFLFIKLN